MTIEQANTGGITSAHAAFERLTNKRYQLHMHRIWHWEKFLVGRKFTQDDIETVVKYLQREIDAKRAYPPQLWFANLIEQPDRFEEYLNDARAKNRNAPAPMTDRGSVLKTSGRCKPCEEKQNSVISMNDRVRWHLEQMRKAISETKTQS